MVRLGREIKGLFSIVQMLIYFIIILCSSTLYLYLITKSVPTSVVVGIFTMVFAFYHSVYLPAKLNREQHLLKELQKYTTSMTFYLQSGYNVLQSLNFSKKNLDKQVVKDIERTMIRIQEQAILDTTHFEKYKFSSLNVFHQILAIKYDVGGNARELFTRANESINFEIVKRDELYRRKRHTKSRIMVMMGIVAVIPLILSFFAKEIYAQFLSMGFIAIGLNAVLFILLLVSLFFLQRTTTNINIYD